MRLAFWWNSLSPHQSAYVRALAQDNDVMVVASQSLSRERGELGWKVPDLGKARVVRAPDWETVRALLRTEEDRIHLLEGWRGCPLSRFILRHADPRMRLGVIAESGDPRFWRGPLRRIRSTVDIFRTRRFVDFILAMGSNGVRWYRQCGAPCRNVFPFCYVVEPPQLSTAMAAGNESAGRFHIMYIGQFVECKSIDVFLRALAAMRQENWFVDVIGSGPLEPRIRRLVEGLELSRSIQFHGLKAWPQAMDALSRADLLVLPSSYDGWGAVVNEALTLGIPVVCTTACGSADLISQPWRGSVVRPGSVSGLAAALDDRVAAGRIPSLRRDKIRRWAKAISGPSVASYFSAVLQHVYEGGVRPTPPWLADQPAGDLS